MKIYRYIIYDKQEGFFPSLTFYMKEKNKLPPKKAIFNSSYDEDKKIT